MILGHVMLKHTIPCTGARQTHDRCVRDLLNDCFVVSNMTPLFSFPTPKQNAFVHLPVACTGQEVTSATWIKVGRG
jgi:hypothetical protein